MAKPTIVVEHLDPELEDWQTLEYQCIADECASDGFNFLLSGLRSVPDISKQLALPTSNLTTKSVETLYSTEQDRRRVCLLDPKGERDLAPEDGETFDVFLFGGILGDDPPRGMLPLAGVALLGVVLLMMCIDRTGDLRKLGFRGRRLGFEQMTTDTAARVTRMVVGNKSTSAEFA